MSQHVRQNDSRGTHPPRHQNVEQDHLVIIKIEGLHCHKCEQAIRKVLLADGGVHEVEVDFLSGQASVLFDERQIAIARLMTLIETAGYHATGFNRSGVGDT